MFTTRRRNDAGQLVVKDTLLEERKAFAERMMRSYETPLKGFFSRRLPINEDSDDLIQEVYLRLVQVKDFSKVEHSKNYLFRIAVNLLRDKIRYHKSRHLTEHVEYIDGLHKSNMPIMDRVIEGKQGLTAIKKELDLLPPRCREVFILHRVGGKTYGQIADILEIAPSTVEKHMIKAIAHLKNCVAIKNDK